MISVNAKHPSQLEILPKNPTLKQAIAYMKTSIDILDWNLKRSRVIREVGKEKFNGYYECLNDSFVVQIDHKGLCGKTLSSNKNHQPFKS